MALGFEDPDTLPVLVGRVERVEGILEEPMGTLETPEGKAEKDVVDGAMELLRLQAYVEGEEEAFGCEALLCARIAGLRRFFSAQGSTAGRAPW